MPPKRKYSGVLQTVSNTSSQVHPFSVCGDTVKPAKSVRDLGIFLDSDMSMKTLADCIQLFCSSATDTQHPSFRQSVSQCYQWRNQEFMLGGSHVSLPLEVGPKSS